ncbi:MAG: hypothetical protein ACREMV_00035 [Gemmatimonadales bacterium]
MALVWLWLLLPPAGAGQGSLDSLVRLLDSPDWHERSDAIAILGRLPPDSLPPGYGPKVIALLEREALQPNAALGQGEGYGEYQLALVRAVRRLKDPTSLRGVALLGVGTSRRSAEFVASHGAAGLPYLDEAWDRDPTAEAPPASLKPGRS